MKKNWRQLTCLCLASGLIMTQAAGCGQSTDTAETKESTQTEEAKTSETAPEAEENIPTDITINAELGEGGKKSITYLAEDISGQWEESEAVLITLNKTSISTESDKVQVDGTTAVIRSGGIYLIEGSLEDGQIRIEAADDEVVRLILNGAAISSKTSSAIYAPTKAKVILTLADGTSNTAADAEEYQTEADDETAPDAAIFTMGDLSINGTGTLEVFGNSEGGIRSKEDLIAAGGELIITSEEDGLKGTDSVIIRDGSYRITSGKDGIKSNNDEEEQKGYIWIDGGSIQIAAEDDGIQAETALIVYGGEIQVSDCQEGLAGKTVDILEGKIQVTAKDDAINSAGPAETEEEKMRDQEGVYTRIAGGELHLNAAADGIDSNGDLYLEGGTVHLSGPVDPGNGILDTNGTASISGGTLFAAGSSGMMQLFDKNSTQNYLIICYEETQKAGTEISVTNAEGVILDTYAPEKDFSAVIYSSPDLTTGEICQVMIGEDTLDLTIEDGMTSHGSIPKGFGGMGRPENGKGLGRPDERPGKGMVPPEPPGNKNRETSAQADDTSDTSGRPGRGQNRTPDGEPRERGAVRGLNQNDGQGRREPSGEGRGQRQGIRFSDETSDES